MADTHHVVRPDGKSRPTGAKPATGARGPGGRAARAAAGVAALLVVAVVLSGCGRSGNRSPFRPGIPDSGSAADGWTASAETTDPADPYTDEPDAPGDGGDLETPVTREPEIEPEPAPPPRPPDRYGAIAVGRDGSNGESWDYNTRAAAEQGALRRCPGSGCKILTSFTNSCGAVVYNSSANRYWGGNGATRAKAEADARSRAGGGRVIAWACTTRYDTD